MSEPHDIMSVNPLLMDRVRLSILASLAAKAQSIDFNTLLDLLNLTKGNLSVHATKLSDAGLIEIEKKFVGKKPVTTYMITPSGRHELKTYLEKIESLMSLLKE